MSAYSTFILDHPDLTHYWKLDESSGSVLDAKGSLDLTVEDATRQVSSLLVSEGGTAYSFDGVNDAVIGSGDSSLHTSVVSAELWTKPNGGQTGWRDLAGYRNLTNTEGWSFTQQDSTGYLLFLVIIGGTMHWAAWSGWSGGSNDQTYHLVGTYDGSTIRLYADGTEVATTSVSGSLSYSGTGNVAFGRSQLTGGGSYYKGTIDEVSVYNDVLTPAMIQAHYEAGLQTMLENKIVGRSSGNTGWSADALQNINEIDQSWQTYSGSSIGVGQDTAHEKFGQSFTAGDSYNQAMVSLFMDKVGNPTDDYYVDICTDNGGVPSSTVLATSDPFDVVNHLYPGVASWALFRFPTPPALTENTLYWIVCRRSGAIDGSNYARWAYDASSSYAGGRYKEWNGSAWVDFSASLDMLFVTFKEDTALYLTAQDDSAVGAKLHMFKSLDHGTTWHEPDPDNAPSVNDGTKPFDTTWVPNPRETFANNSVTGVSVLYFSGANTLRIRQFDLENQVWRTTDYPNADLTTTASYERPVRVVATQWDNRFWFTTSTDDADIVHNEAYSSLGTPDVELGANSLEASTVTAAVADSTYEGPLDRVVHAFFYDIENADFTAKTAIAAAVDLDTNAADSETEHASAVYQVFDDTVIAAYIDVDGTLQERVVTLGGTITSGSLATQHQVSSSTSYAGRRLATLEFDGDYYIFAEHSTGIDYFTDVGGSGSWSSVENWKTSLTDPALSSACPVEGVGIVVCYTSSGDTFTELLVPSTGETVLLDSDLSATATLAALSSAIRALNHSPDLILKTGSFSQLNGAVFGGTAGEFRKLYQSFFVTESSTATTLEVDIWPEGAPTDSLIFRLCDDSAGLPGSTLTSVEVLASSLIAGEANRYCFEFDSAAALEPGQTYWLTAERTGATRDQVNFCRVGVTTVNWEGSAYSLYTLDNGTTVTQYPDYDINFGLYDGPRFEILSGRSSLSSSLVRNAAYTSALDATADLSMDLVRDRRVLSTLSAEGQLAAQPAITKPFVGTLSSEGVLEAQAVTTRRFLSALAAEGTLATDIDITKTLLAALDADSDLSLTLELTAVLQAALDAEGTISADMALVRGLTGTLDAQADLLGSMDATRTFVSSLSAEGILALLAFGSTQVIGSLLRISPDDLLTLIRTTPTDSLEVSQVMTLIRTSPSDSLLMTLDATALAPIALAIVAPDDPFTDLLTITESADPFSLARTLLNDPLNLSRAEGDDIS